MFLLGYNYQVTIYLIKLVNARSKIQDHARFKNLKSDIKHVSRF